MFSVEQRVRVNAKFTNGGLFEELPYISIHISVYASVNMR